MSIAQGYTLRVMTVRTSLGPRTLVSVKNEKSGEHYSVTQGRRGLRCNCPHFINRCRGTNRVCKHCDMAAEVLAAPEPATVAVAAQIGPELAATAAREVEERRAAYLRQRDRDFPPD